MPVFCCIAKLEYVYATAKRVICSGQGMLADADKLRQ